MNFATYMVDNIEKIGIVNNEKTKVLDLDKLSDFENFDNMLSLIEGWNDKFNKLLEEALNKMNIWEEKARNTDQVKMLAPIPKLKRNVICLGLNYKDHIEESQSALRLKMKLPEFPIYFTKMPLNPIGTGQSINSHSQITQEVDYEVELAVVIGKSGIDIKPGEVENHIFGYTILNDITARDLQRNHKQWVRGKSLDTFTAIGPWITHKSVIPLPVELKLYSKVNGEFRQNSNTKNFIFDIPYIISELSKGTRLEAGDIIATGTPAGVGMGFDPPKYLKSGDLVECYIENIGSLTNPVI